MCVISRASACRAVESRRLQRNHIALQLQQLEERRRCLQRELLEEEAALRETEERLRQVNMAGDWRSTLRGAGPTVQLLTVLVLTPGRLQLEWAGHHSNTGTSELLWEVP
eukprot:jgi/Chrzof1/2731/Cz11g27050.t1